MKKLIVRGFLIFKFTSVLGKAGLLKTKLYGDIDINLEIPEFIRFSHYTLLWNTDPPNEEAVAQIFEDMLWVL